MNAAAVVLANAALLASTALLAQGPPPHVGYVYPAGAQRGTVAEVTVGGKDLQAEAAAVFAGRGITASCIGYTRPLTNRERNTAREELQKLQQQRRQQPLDDAQRARLAELRQLLASNPRQQPNPQIAETVRLRLELAADAAPGWQELRLSTGTGLSNPLRFFVDGDRCQLEQEPNDAAAEAGAALPLPLCIDGQILPGDVDRFRIRAAAGVQLVATVEARALMPYLADAVPGWFQATLALCDASGRQLAFADDHNGSPDPVLACTLPRDGDYVLVIQDALFRGREDFVYRLRVGELPQLDAVLPLGCRAGERAELQLRGLHVPAVLPVQFQAPGLQWLQVDGQHGRSNALPFAVGELPEVRERSGAGGPQRLSLPQLVNGCIGQAGEVDVFEFDGRSGQPLVAEVTARRLGSPLDSLLCLADASGRELARNDDHVDAGAGLSTHHADSLLSLLLPHDGVYRLRVADTQGRGSAVHAYRLRVSAPLPDFELRVEPSAINLRAGGTAVCTVHALRRDGFAGDIDLLLRQPPPGFELAGGRIPGRLDRVRFTITAPPVAPPQVLQLQFEGRARIGGREVVRKAVAADDMMQAFLWRQLVPAAAAWCAITRGGAPLRLQLPGAAVPLRLAPGGSAELALTAPRRRPLPDGVEFALREPPPGLALTAERTATGASLTLRASAGEVAHGDAGNLIIDVFVRRTLPGRDGQPPRQQRSQVATLPAIPYQVR